MKSLFFTIFFFTIRPCFADITLTESQARQISERIFGNECSGKKDNLVSWNSKEEFASLGIGHFIWYPEGYVGPFHEQFPLLVAFYQTKKITLPALLREHKSCPWKSREDFLKQTHSPQVQELKDFLYETKEIQAQFLTQRLMLCLPIICKNLAPSDKKVVEARLLALAASAKGLYALMDYINFKGEGVLLTERYQGHGWGLLQVLQEMDSDQDPLSAFQKAAKKVLERRIQLCPPERNDASFKKGWFNRIDSYSR